MRCVLKVLIVATAVAVISAPAMARAGGYVSPGASSNNMLGWNAGAGVMGFFNDHVGLRGDIKYLRGFEDTNTGVNVIDLNAPGQLHFWRAAVGVVLR